jgi:heparan-alpha-glucosaminide N-acetyltransferase
MPKLTEDSPFDSEPEEKLQPRQARLASIDAYRGLVMFLMMAEVLRFGSMKSKFPDSPTWDFLAHHQDHVPWVGCSLHDMIQPSFSFLVGVALPFSIASRLARNQSRVAMTIHAFWRAFVLAALGIFLRSTGSDRTNFTFEDTLTQIGLGYGFLFLLALRPPRDQWIALVVILVGYWAAFALYTPGEGFSLKDVGVPVDWPHLHEGFAAHWNKNANLAWAFDTWFLNRFPRAKPFLYNGGGYATLSFIPTLGTMILGLLAGNVLRREDRPVGAKLLWFVIAGAITLAAGWALNHYGICPNVKRIWTPSWVLYSGGICFFMLAVWYLLLDVLPLSPVAFPLMVIGMNSIAAYCMSHLIVQFIVKTYKTHLGPEIFRSFGREYEPLCQGIAILLVEWLILFWMYRRQIFLRI